jgi:hypothetical protein
MQLPTRGIILVCALLGGNAWRGLTLRPDLTPIPAMAMTKGSSVADKNPRANRERMSRSRRAINKAGKPRTTKNNIRNIGNWSSANLDVVRACKS